MCTLRLCVLKDIERKQNSWKCNRNAFVLACIFLCFLLFVIAKISISTNVDFMLTVLSKGWEILPSKPYQATSKNCSKVFLQYLLSLNLLFFCALKRVLVFLEADFFPLRIDNKCIYGFFSHRFVARGRKKTLKISL